MSQTIPPSFAAFQSAPRRHRVIPPAAVAVAVDAPQLPSPLPPPPPSEDKRPRHRHAAALEEALQLLKTLSAQADHPVVVEEDEDDEEGIIARLQADAGWIYSTSVDGVRILTREPDSNSATATATDGARPGRGRAGVRSDEDLPWIRGEGWIEGRWRLEDVSQAVLNVGARGVWDPRFDPFRSSVLAHLDEKDTLWSMHIRAELGTDRDACLVSTVELEADKQRAYVASTSVEDALVPRHGSRTQIHLNGYCFRALPRQPHFEKPPAKASRAAKPPVANRPSHRRTKSSMSFRQSGGMLSPGLSQPPPLPTIDGAGAGFPFGARGPAFGRQSSSRDGDEDSEQGSSPQPGKIPPPELNPFDSTAAAFLTSPLPPASSKLPFLKTRTRLDEQPAAAHATPSDRPGIHVSLIVHVSPGFNLPQTTVNQLSIDIPLSIAAISRYLTLYGFPAYIVRRPSLDIMDEQFDPVAATYRVVYRSTAAVEEEEPEPVRIRFFGGTFAKGRFDIEVHGVEDIDDWRLEYDVEPEVPPETKRTRPEKDNTEFDAVEAQGRTQPSHHRAHNRPTTSRKTSLSVLASPAQIAGIESLPLATSPTSPNSAPSQRTSRDMFGQASRHRSSASSSSSSSSSTASLARRQTTTNNNTASIIDPSRLPGPLGGCTLLIPRPSSTRHHPVTVTITRNSSAVSRASHTLSARSRALGRAVRALHAHAHAHAHGGVGVGGDTVEEMLQGSKIGSDARARMCLGQARTVLEEIWKADEKVKERDRAVKRELLDDDDDEEGLQNVAVELAQEVGHHYRSSTRTRTRAGRGTEEHDSGAVRIGSGLGLGLDGIQEVTGDA